MYQIDKLDQRSYLLKEKLGLIFEFVYLEIILFCEYLHATYASLPVLNDFYYCFGILII